jgi:uncharacterized Rossmann fold enzyme
LKKAIKEKNLEEAERLIDDLIEDTQKNIEDEIGIHTGGRTS